MCSADELLEKLLRYKCPRKCTRRAGVYLFRATKIYIILQIGNPFMKSCPRVCVYVKEKEKKGALFSSISKFTEIIFLFT